MWLIDLEHALTLMRLFLVILVIGCAMGALALLVFMFGGVGG